MRPVYAAEDGTVSATQLWDGHTTDERSMQSYGNYVDIRHTDYRQQSLVTRYAHLFKFIVAKGEKVKEGQLIGYSGATGNVFGAHLHFEVLLGGKRLARRGQMHTAAVAHQQRKAAVALEPRQQLRQRRLGHTQRLRRGRHARALHRF